jgi:hypothetical protein
LFATWFDKWRRFASDPFTFGVYILLFRGAAAKKKAELKARPSPTGRYEDDARLSHHRLQ